MTDIRGRCGLIDRMRCLVAACLVPVRLLAEPWRLAMAAVLLLSTALLLVPAAILLLATAVLLVSAILLLAAGVLRPVMLRGRAV